MGESKEEKKIRTHFGVSNGDQLQGGLLGHMMYLCNLKCFCIPQGQVWGQTFVISMENIFILHIYMHGILNERTGKICGGATTSMRSPREVGVLKLAQNRAVGARFSLGVIK